MRNNCDEDALGELYDRYELKIYNYIYRRTSNQTLAEDLTAQVFLKMLEAIHNDKTWHSSFSGWLYRIAHNLVIDHYRTRDRQKQISIDDAPVMPTPVTTRCERQRSLWTPSIYGRPSEDSPTTRRK